MRIGTAAGSPPSYAFTDQEKDCSTGFYNYDARHYDPKASRFISPDSLLPDPYDPQQLNRYAYARNNPLKYVDPSGHANSDYDLEDDEDGYGGFGGLGIGNPDSHDPSHSEDNIGSPGFEWGVEGFNINDRKDNSLSQRAWDVLGNYFSVSMSFTVMGIWHTTSKNVEQRTISFDLIGVSYDLKIGCIPPHDEEVVEATLGLSKHLGIGVYFPGINYAGDPNCAGIYLHGGIGVGSPVGISGTFPVGIGPLDED